MDLAKLSAELADDPLGRGYAGMSDAEAAASLNATDREKPRRVPVGELLTVLRDRGKWLAIKVSDLEPAAAARDLFEGAQIVPDVNLANPAMQAGLDGLQDADLIDAGTRADIEALGETRRSRAEELGLLGRSPEVGPAHVARARAGDF